MTDFDSQAGQNVGLEIWRIENMKPVRIDKNDYGKFYSGDCYICLNTTEKKGQRQMDLFFWLGESSSQDEKGAVAYQTVFLDDKLGGLPVQHREVQGHESPQFLSLFKSGIEILDGGVASAFRHVDPSAYQPRLFHLKGKRNVRVQQVKLDRGSLNDGDVFILDKGLTLYQWNGLHANKYEKFKGLEITTKIKNEERGGKPEIVVLESGKNDQKEEGFWSLLGGYGAIKSEAEGGSDDQKGGEPQLLVFSNGSFATVATGKFTKDQLSTENIYVVDSGTEIFVWIGKGSEIAARKEAMKLAQDFLTSQGRPDWTPITKLQETGETPAFKACFSVWDPPRVVDFKQSGPVNKEEVNIDAAALHVQQRAAEEKMVDDAKGHVKVWRIENFDKAEVDESEYGQFFMGDSYIVLYEYQVKGKPHYIIYFWQGRLSSTDEKGASALLTKQLDDQLTATSSASPVQVRVVQDKEPNHFLSLFKGKMVVHQGGAASGFKNRQDVEQARSGAALYHIKGTNPINTRGVQVDAVAANLNSGDVFVLLTDSNMYLWYGSGANDTERATAKNISQQILQGSRSVSEFPEGSEPQEFWDALGGQTEYPTSGALASGAHEPRLFQCSNVSGTFKVEEVFDFSQDDLINDDVMLLDTFEAVYVWIGHNALQEEKDNAMKVALDYVAKATDGRDPSCPVYKVHAGGEPPVFTCHFRGWNEDLANDFSDPYQKKLAALKQSGAVGTESKGAAAPAAAAAPAPKVEKKLEAVTADSIGFAKGTFSYADLKAKQVPNIDMTKQESYLSDAEFQTVFKTTKAEFYKLPKWKQDNAKKAAGLF